MCRPHLLIFAVYIFTLGRSPTLVDVKNIEYTFFAIWLLGHHSQSLLPIWFLSSRIYPATHQTKDHHQKWQKRLFARASFMAREVCNHRWLCRILCAESFNWNQNTYNPTLINLLLSPQPTQFHIVAVDGSSEMHSQEIKLLTSEICRSN